MIGNGLGIPMVAARFMGGGGVPAPVIPGAAKPVMPITPTVEWHPHTDALTMMSGECQFLGWVDAASNVLNVASVLSGAIVAGNHLVLDDYPASHHLRIVAQINSTQWRISATLDIRLGLSGAPVPMRTTGSTLIWGTGGPHPMTGLLGPSNAPYGPPWLGELETGLKVGRFSLAAHPAEYSGRQGSVLQNTTLTGLDSHNHTIIIVGLIHDKASETLFSLGTRDGPTGKFRSMQQRRQIGATVEEYEMPFLATDGRNLALLGGNDGIPAPNRNRLIPGCSLAVMAVSFSTPGGKADTGSAATITFWNNFASWTTVRTISRVKDMAGFELGRSSMGTNTAGSFGPMDVAYMALYANDELAAGSGGTFVTRTATNFAAACAYLNEHYEREEFTKRLVFLGDSRVDHDNMGGSSPPMKLAEMLPANVQVVDLSQGGARAMIPYANKLAPQHFLGSAMLLPGGPDNNGVALLYGRNDTGSLGPNGGTTLRSAERGQLAYNGNVVVGGAPVLGSLDTTFQGYIVAGTSQIVFTTPPPAGALVVPMEITWPGQTIAAVTTDTTGGFRPSGTVPAVGSAGSPVAFTARLGNYVRLAQACLAAGYKPWIIHEPYLNNGTIDDGQVVIRQRLNDSLLTDTDAQPGGAYAGRYVFTDIPSIVYEGLRAWGDQAASYPLGYKDLEHTTERAIVPWVTGAETPQHGLLAGAKALLGV